jgi:hypothetical protein
MPQPTVIPRRTAGVAAVALTAGSLGLVFAGGSTAAAAGAPICTDPALTSHGAADNGDGTTSVVLVGTTDTKTATIVIPANVRVARLDVCGAQGSPATAGAAPGGQGGRTQATLAVTPGDGLLLFAGGTASGGAPGVGGGAGGGYSAVFRGASATPAAAVVYAGGGGGGGGGNSAAGSGDGGVGGGTQGEAGASGAGDLMGKGGGGPGTFTVPGAGGQPDTDFSSGEAGQDGAGQDGGNGGQGAAGNNTGGGGGGGDGWTGGGGGAGGGSRPSGPSSQVNDAGGGGGGGSGHFDSGTAVSRASTVGNARSGPGTVVITWGNPVAPSFVTDRFDDGANTNSSYSRLVTVSAVPTAAIAVSSGALPPGITLTDNHNNTATFAGTPTATGKYLFTLTASNGVAPDATQPDSITVFTAPTPSPVASGTASPSATATATATGAAPTRSRLQLTTSTPLIRAGTNAELTASGGAPQQSYALRCYTRPSGTYSTARSGAFNTTGAPVHFTLFLGRNTRCFIQYAGTTQGASPSVVINVSTVLSLSTVRGGVRTVVFQGRNLPRVAGQLITLYRVDSASNEIRTANLKTDASGVFRVRRTFTGAGTFRFRVRTPQTLSNAPGVSNTITVRVF